MCGIAGMIGDGCADFVYDSLLKMQYRGYDSWGMAVAPKDMNQPIHLSRCVGKMDGDKKEIGHGHNDGMAIGHTRWASNGKVSVENAHPVQHGSTYVVHNGNVENCEHLRKWLQEQNVCPLGATDTAIIAAILNLQITALLEAIEVNKFDDWEILDSAGRLAKEIIHGSNTFIAIDDRVDGLILIVSNGQPLYIYGAQIASDLKAFAQEYAGEHAIYLDNGSVGVINKFGDLPSSMGWSTVEIPHPETICRKHGDMATEIRQQAELTKWAQVISTNQNYWPDLDSQSILPPTKKMVLFGCGSSYYAALLGKQYLEQLAEMPVEVKYSIELAYGRLFDDGQTTYLAMTQSGETKDTLDAMNRLVKAGLRERLWLLTNQTASTAANYASQIFNLGCGTEVGVAATKTFSAQCLALLSLAKSYCGRLFDLEVAKLVQKRLDESKGIFASSVEAHLDDVTNQASLYAFAGLLRNYNHLLILGSEASWPIALEGALKIKEIAYQHAEAVFSSEIKHGPLALIDNGVYSIFIVLHSSTVKKVVSNIDEVIARGGKVGVICDQESWEDFIEERFEDKKIHSTQIIPHMHGAYKPLFAAIHFQLLAYYMAVQAGHDVDKPRHLAKSVTV